MSNFSKWTESIDRYILDEMSAAERILFEQEMEQNPTLKAEVTDQKELLKALEMHEELVSLKANIHQAHIEIIKTQKPVWEVWVKKYSKYAAVAACASIFTIAATFTLLGQMFGFSRFSQVDAYTKLKSDVRKISKNQQSLWQQISSIEKTEESADEISQTFGTCFPISTNGYLVTNAHLVQGAKSLQLESDNLDNSYSAEVVYEDKLNDLAILKVNDSTFTGFKLVPYLFKSKLSKIGEEVYTLGYPKHDIVYGEGSISSMTGFQGDTMAYQISIPVNPGNSGAPLLNSQGEIIGLISGKNLNQDGAAFAIKSAHIINAVKHIEEKGETASLPTKNRLKNRKRTDQIDQLQEIVYRLKVQH